MFIPQHACHISSVSMVPYCYLFVSALFLSAFICCFRMRMHQQFSKHTDKCFQLLKHNVKQNLGWEVIQMKTYNDVVYVQIVCWLIKGPLTENKTLGRSTKLWQCELFELKQNQKPQ